MPLPFPELPRIPQTALTASRNFYRTGKAKFRLSATAPQTTGTAYASTQKVLVDGRSVEFQAYALKDANGYDTNYVKLRDVAVVLNGSAARFEVGWDGEIGRAHV